jgi:hypothetical protein
MEFKVSQSFPNPSKSISYEGNILAIGSCFAQNMGSLLAQHHFNLVLNPFGIVFNPVSLAYQLGCLLDPSSFKKEKYVAQHQELYHSWLHHGSYSTSHEAEFYTKIEQDILLGHEQLKQASTLIITWGTANVYQLLGTDIVVSNCHKFPSNVFQKRRLSVAEIVAAYQPILASLSAINPGLQIVWSVSPVKYLRDGLNQNNLSKSTLFLAMEELMNAYPNSYYFPAFEIQQDELRDYRFYDADMAHPSAQAIAYIWEQFTSHCLDAETQKMMQQIAEFNRAMQHRVLHADSSEYRAFKQQTLAKIKQFSLLHPRINLDEVVGYFEGKSC